MKAPGAWRDVQIDLDGRYEDIWFVNEQVGWAASANGYLHSSTDGGETWPAFQQFMPDTVDGSAVCRCLGFAPNGGVGWAGGWRGKTAVLKRWSGDSTWEVVQNLPSEAPVKLCGLWAVDDQVMFAAGTNEPADQTPRILSTRNRGKTWQVKDLSRLADCLIDVYFHDARRGWVVGGKRRTPDGPPVRSDLCPVVLETTDGGETWEDLIDGKSLSTVGEWGWKIAVIDPRRAFISLESEAAGGVLRFDGETWQRLEVPGGYRLQGIGFLDRDRGWVGSSYVADRVWTTEDGGETWQDVAGPPAQVNRFRFYKTFGVACGVSVYRFDSMATAVARAVSNATRIIQRPPGATGLRGHRPVDIDLVVPPSARRLLVEIRDPNGGVLKRLVDERFPAPGHRRLRWADDSKQPLAFYLCRVVADDRAEVVPIAFTDG
jgi:photosystem II stability/assembly factor-like uncharacterized protein